MTEAEKIVAAAGSALFVGYIGGRLQAWHNYRRDAKLRREAELDNLENGYLAKKSTRPNLDAESCQRMQLLQQLGAHKFTYSEIAKVQNSIMARGFADPLTAHSESLGLLENYPYCVFEWAKENKANLGSIVSVLEKWIAIHEADNIDDESELGQRLLNWRITLEIWKRNEKSRSEMTLI